MKEFNKVMQIVGVGYSLVITGITIWFVANARKVSKNQEKINEELMKAEAKRIHDLQELAKKDKERREKIRKFMNEKDVNKAKELMNDIKVDITKRV